MVASKVIRRSVFENLSDYIRNNIVGVKEEAGKISWVSKEASFELNFIEDKVNGRYVYYVNLFRNEVEVPKILDMLVEERGGKDVE